MCGDLVSDQSGTEGKVKFALLFSRQPTKKKDRALAYCELCHRDRTEPRYLGIPGDRVLYHQVGMTRPAARMLCHVCVKSVHPVSFHKRFALTTSRARKAELRHRRTQCVQASGGRVSLVVTLVGAQGEAANAASGFRVCVIVMGRVTGRARCPMLGSNGIPSGQLSGGPGLSV